MDMYKRIEASYIWFLLICVSNTFAFCLLFVDLIRRACMSLRVTGLIFISYLAESQVLNFLFHSWEIPANKGFNQK